MAWENATEVVGKIFRLQNYFLNLIFVKQNKMNTCSSRKGKLAKAGFLVTLLSSLGLYFYPGSWGLFVAIVTCKTLAPFSASLRRCAGRWTAFQWCAPTYSPRWSVQPREEDELWDPVPESSEPQLRHPDPETERFSNHRGRSQPQNQPGTGQRERSWLQGRAPLRLYPGKEHRRLTLPKEILCLTHEKTVANKIARPNTYATPALRVALFVESAEVGP